MKANPLVCALLVLLAVAVQLPAQQPMAQYNLGVCYYKGDGVVKDYAEAVKLFRKAAEQNHAQAQCWLGFCYYKGDGVAKDEAEAVKWFRKAAEQNNADAQCYLGACYANGQGVVKYYVEAVKWYRKAAEQNNAQAQCNLGVCYRDGQGVAKDYVEAVKWFRKAAEQNHAQAQCHLGFCYALGRGVAKDEAEAVKWFRKAAEQNYAIAQYYLGVCYEDGQGVVKDYVEAYKWGNLAAANKDEYIAMTAAKTMPWLESQMSPEQIAEGQRLSHEYLLDRIAAESKAKPSTPAKPSTSDWEPVKPATDEFGGVLVGEASQPTPRAVVGKKAQTDWGDVVEDIVVVVLVVCALFLFGLTFFRLVRYVRRMKMKRIGEMKLANLSSVVAKLIVAVMLFAAVGRHDYDYYTLLRCAAFGVVAFTAFQAGRLKQFGWLFVFVSVAVMLNPITPLHLKRETWAFVDAAAAVLLLVSIATIEAQAMNKSVKRFLFWCLFLLALFGIVACYFLSQNVPAKGTSGVLSEGYINPSTVKLPPLHRK